MYHFYASLLSIGLLTIKPIHKNRAKKESKTYLKWKLKY
jgi:hypothetical protein